MIKETDTKVNTAIELIIKMWGYARKKYDKLSNTELCATKSH